MGKVQAVAGGQVAGVPKTLHAEESARCSWMENSTPVASRASVSACATRTGAWRRGFCLSHHWRYRAARLLAVRRRARDSHARFLRARARGRTYGACAAATAHCADCGCMGGSGHRGRGKCRGMGCAEHHVERRQIAGADGACRRCCTVRPSAVLMRSRPPTTSI